ncbi:MAG: DUF6768 family protein [Wenzhouxiangella sp.]
MSIDQRIRRELQQQGGPVEDLKAEQTGLFPMLLRVFTGGLARWAGFAMALTLVSFGVTIWTGYEFFTAGNIDDRVFWGVLVLAAFHALSMFKLWFFMEMNRHSVTREVKRVEIALARLDEHGQDRS